MPELPLAETIRRVRARLADAARRAGRDPAGVGLVAVTKGVSADRVRMAAAAGISCIGESRVQEAVAKSADLADLSLEWHLVGHLQRNKVPQAVGRFALLHGVDSNALMQAISDRAVCCGLRQRILLQVNMAADPRKHGFLPEDVPAALALAGDLPGVEVLGFMTVPPQAPDPEASRPVFSGLRALRDRLAPGLEQLSMGMSGDFDIAVEEGATFVRIGTAIFGSRN